MSMRDAAIAHAERRAEREGRRMWVYHVAQDMFGRHDVWYVRSFEEGVPHGRDVTPVYSTPSTKEEL